MKKLGIILTILTVLIIATFYPGINREKILSTLNSTDWIAQQHTDSKVLEQDLQIIPVPFGVLASTYEGQWYVTFWGRAI